MNNDELCKKTNDMREGIGKMKWGNMNFQQLKRKVYLIVLPCILLTSIFTVYFQWHDQQLNFAFYMNVLFIIAFTVGWFTAYWNKWTMIMEYTILILLYIYFAMATFSFARNFASGVGILGDGLFVIWLPLVVMYTFAVLKKRMAMTLSVFLLVITMTPVWIYFERFSSHALAFFIQLTIATFSYIVILIYAMKMIQKEAEMEAMKKQLYIDPLTHIGNRYQMDEWLAHFFERAPQSTFSIIFFDIDYFKDINDQYGHLVGDQVLQEIVICIQQEIGENQFFGRWGGEEFIVVTEASKKEAFKIAEQLRKAIEQYSFTEVGHVTASFGVMAYEEGDTIDSLLKRVDDKLYESKRQGRNQVR